MGLWVEQGRDSGRLGKSPPPFQELLGLDADKV